MTPDTPGATARRSNRRGSSASAAEVRPGGSSDPADGAGPSRGRGPVRTTLRILFVVLLAILLAGVATAVYIGVLASTDDRSRTDAIVVLGASQFDGTPSPVLQSRLAHARQLALAGVSSQIITVGGKQTGDRFTEAQAGRSWLVKQGVPANQVTAVATGSDTAESLNAVATLMAKKGWRSITLVTDPVHEARSAAIARGLGIEPHLSPTNGGPGSDVTADYLTRESLGLMHYWAWQRWSMPSVISSQ